MEKKKYKAAFIAIGFVVLLLTGDVMAAWSNRGRGREIPQEYGQRQRLRQGMGRGRGFGAGQEAWEGPVQRRGLRQGLGRGRGFGPGQEARQGPGARRGIRQGLGRGRDAAYDRAWDAVADLAPVKKLWKIPCRDAAYDRV